MSAKPRFSSTARGTSQGLGRPGAGGARRARRAPYLAGMATRRQRAKGAAGGKRTASRRTANRTAGTKRRPAARRGRKASSGAGTREARAAEAARNIESAAREPPVFLVAEPAREEAREAEQASGVESADRAEAAALARAAAVAAEAAEEQLRSRVAAASRVLHPAPLSLGILAPDGGRARAPRNVRVRDGARHRRAPARADHPDRAAPHRPRLPPATRGVRRRRPGATGRDWARTGANGREGLSRVEGPSGPPFRSSDRWSHRRRLARGRRRLRDRRPARRRGARRAAGRRRSARRSAGSTRAPPRAGAPRRP